jgi:hypothetical protein
MKVINSSDKITPFGGFSFSFKTFKDSGPCDLIDKHLGVRVKGLGFSNSVIFANHMAVFFHGGDATEDVNDHLRPYLQQVKGLEVCSADTILRGIKELATDTITLENPSTKVKHDFTINKKLNELLVKSLKKNGLLKKW